MVGACVGSSVWQARCVGEGGRQKGKAGGVGRQKWSSMVLPGYRYGKARCKQRLPWKGRHEMPCR